MKNPNYLHYIRKQHITKKADIQIILPTYFSYQITKKTIKKLYQQKNITFDILLIDNGGADYQRLKKVFPKLNYLVLKEDVYSGGAERIGAEIAIKYQYRYVIFNDNDALLLSNNSLYKLSKLIELDKTIGAVVPKNIEEDNLPTKDRFIQNFGFNYLFAKVSAIKKSGLHNFYLFFQGDDLHFCFKLTEKYKILQSGDTFFYHPIKPEAYLSYLKMYFSFRAHLFIIIYEKKISLKKRAKLLIQLFFKAIYRFVLYFYFGELSRYYSTWKIIIKDTVDWGMPHQQLLPKDNLFFKEIKKNQRNFFYDYSKTHIVFPFVKYLKYRSNFYQKDYYYRLEKK